MYKVELYDGFTRIASDGFVTVLSKVTNEICDDLSMVYSVDELEFIHVHLKGFPQINGLLIRVQLTFEESDDVLSVVHDRLDKVIGCTTIPEDQPGLSYICVHKRGFCSYYSEINFWYKFDEKEENIIRDFNKCFLFGGNDIYL